MTRIICHYINFQFSPISSYIWASTGSLPIQSPDYKALFTSLESQLCDEDSDQEKVCCSNKVGDRKFLFNSLHCFFTDLIKFDYWLQKIYNGLRLDANTAKDTYPWMARLGSRFSILKAPLDDTAKVSILNSKTLIILLLVWFDLTVNTVDNRDLLVLDGTKFCGGVVVHERWFMFVS